MHKSLVSVVIPTYKRDKSLCKAIDAAMNQTYPNVEIIVVNDNGLDSEFTPVVREIINEYSEKTDIVYIENKNNLGGSGARNEGIKKAKGDYIAFLDDDDDIKSYKIEKQIEVFEKSQDDKLALVYCYVEQVDSKGNVNYVVKNNARGNCLYEAMKTDCIAPTSLWLAKKSALEDVGMFTIVPNKQDATLILKLLVAGYSVDYVPEVLCTYANFNVGEKITTYGPKQIKGEKLYLEKCREAYKVLPKRQQKNIEFAFSYRLYGMHRANSMIPEMKADKHNMFKMNLVKAHLFFLKRKARNFLRTIKRALHH